MLNDEQGQALHDRLTRGETLLDSEQTELDQWYSQHDHQESAVLGRVLPDSASAELEAQVSAAVGHLQRVTQRIEKLTADNATVRQENAELQRQLTRKSAALAV